LSVRTWTIESFSRPGATYEVVLHLVNRGSFKAGSFSCSCAAWRFQRRPVSERTCKHIQEVQAHVRSWDTFHAIKEIKGSEMEFKEEAVANGRVAALIDAIMKQ